MVAESRWKQWQSRTVIVAEFRRSPSPAIVRWNHAASELMGLVHTVGANGQALDLEQIFEEGAQVKESVAAITAPQLMKVLWRRADRTTVKIRVLMIPAAVLNDDSETIVGFAIPME